MVYQLELPQQWKIHNVFHANLLTPYVETEMHGENFTNPPPDIIEGKPEYEVEEIIRSRRVGEPMMQKSVTNYGKANVQNVLKL